MSKSFSKPLLAWYNKNKSDLPWRNTDDPYKILISEFMLQQTQVSTVIPYYNKWVKSFPNIHSVAASNDNNLLKHWEGLGYYRRAMYLKETCQQIIDIYNANIPEDINDLLSLKGIGSYTAAAISSIAYQRPNPVIDGNVKRILSRIFLIIEFNGSIHKEMMDYLTSIIPIRNPGDFNQAMMELGRLICKPKSPLCLQCVIKKYCKSYKTDSVHLYPSAKSKKNLPHYNIGIGVVWKKDKILITKRKKNMLLGGLWEFPGGKIKLNESVIDSIKRELYEELEIEVDVKDFITSVKHSYSHFSIKLYVHHCIYVGGKIKCHSSDEWRWIKQTEFDDYPFPSANHKIFPFIPRENPCTC